MSDIDPTEFGRLSAKVELLESQVAEMRSDMKLLLELANRGKGALWLLMGVSSIMGAVASKALTWSGWIPK